jgi:hypothetical protein
MSESKLDRQLDIVIFCNEYTFSLANGGPLLV